MCERSLPGANIAAPRKADSPAAWLMSRTLPVDKRLKVGLMLECSQQDRSIQSFHAQSVDMALALSGTDQSDLPIHSFEACVKQALLKPVKTGTASGRRA